MYKYGLWERVHAGPRVCRHGSEGLQAWVQGSVGMGLNESGTFASLTKELSVSG